MKKKFLTFLLAICFMLPCAFMLTACGKEPPADPPVTYNLSLYSATDLKDKLESLDIYFNGEEQSIVYDNSVWGTYSVDDGTNLLIKMTTKQSVKYTTDDVKFSEKEGKEFNKTIEVKQNGLTQNIIEISVNNIKSDYSFTFDLKDSEETFEIASMTPEFDYVITTNGNNRQSNLEKDFANIAIWSDLSEHFVSYANIKNYNQFLINYNLSTYEAAVEKYNYLKGLDEEDEDYVYDLEGTYVDPAKVVLGLENINTVDFKIYVSFNTDVIKFTSEVLNNLVVLRDKSGAKADVSLTFNPTATTKNGIVCYEYTLEEDKLENITATSTIALTYTKDLDASGDEEINELRTLAGYYNTEGHKFSSNTYTFDLTNSVSISAFLVGDSRFDYDENKPIDEEKVVYINVGLPSYVDETKFDLYLGNTSKKIKATYAPSGDSYDDYTHYVTIPANVYPSEYGNAEYFFFTLVPNVANIDDVINTTTHTLIPVTTEVADVVMNSVHETYLEAGSTNLKLWRTTTSQDQTSQTQYLITSNDAHPYGISNLTIDKRFYYTIYDVLGLEVTANGNTYKINLNLKELFEQFKEDPNASNIIRVYYKSEAQDIPNSSNETLESPYLVLIVGSEYVVINDIYFGDVVYDGTGITFKIVSDTVGKTAVKAYSCYGSETETAVDTDLKIKLGNQELTQQNGEYLLERGVTYNFEITLNEAYKPTDPNISYTSYALSLFRVFYDDGTSGGNCDGFEITEEEVNGKIVGTIRIVSPLDYHSNIEQYMRKIPYSYISLGINYWLYEG